MSWRPWPSYVLNSTPLPDRDGLQMSKSYSSPGQLFGQGSRGGCPVWAPAQGLLALTSASTRCHRSLVAQLAEHLTVNQRVTGSSPVRGANSSRFDWVLSILNGTIGIEILPDRLLYPDARQGSALAAGVAAPRCALGVEYQAVRPGDAGCPYAVFAAGETFGGPVGDE